MNEPHFRGNFFRHGFTSLFIFNFLTTKLTSTKRNSFYLKG